MKKHLLATAESELSKIDFELQYDSEVEKLIKSIQVSKGRYERTEIKTQEELDKLFKELKSFTSFKECNIDFSTRSQKLNYEEMIDFLQVQFNIIQRNNRGR